MRGYSGTRLRPTNKAFGKACALQRGRLAQQVSPQPDPVARAYAEDGPGRDAARLPHPAGRRPVLRLDRRPDKLIRTLASDLRIGCSAQRSVECRQLLPRSGGDQRQTARGPVERRRRIGGLAERLEHSALREALCSGSLEPPGCEQPLTENPVWLRRGRRVGGRCHGPPLMGRPMAWLGAGQGLTWLKRVPQLASAVRVPPQLPSCGPASANHSASVQVWLMYSFAIQIELPSATAAP
jgi:hypothetical protein